MRFSLLVGSTVVVDIVSKYILFSCLLPFREKGREKMKININLFFSLYRRERRDRQRNLFDLIDIYIYDHTARFLHHHLSICLSVFYPIRKRKRDNASVIHQTTWKSFLFYENCSNNDEYTLGKWTDWPSYQFRMKEHWYRYIYFSYIWPSISIIVSFCYIDHFKWMYTWFIRCLSDRLWYVCRLIIILYCK